MKRKSFAGLVGLATMAGGMVLVAATPASAAAPDGTGTVAYFGEKSAAVRSPKGCGNYQSRSRFLVSGSLGTSAFGSIKYESYLLNVLTYTGLYYVPNSTSPTQAQSRSHYGGGYHGYSSWMTVVR